MHARTSETAATKVVVFRLTLDLLRGVAQTMRKHRRVQFKPGTSALIMAVAIGDFESRPMSAAKIAEYIGIPRTSVVRRLQALEDAGILARNCNSSFVLAHHDVCGTGRDAAQMIHRASRELSKMDND
jgi:DNA-binding transcriptional ArsR family regulator